MKDGSHILAGITSREIGMQKVYQYKKLFLFQVVSSTHEKMKFIFEKDLPDVYTRVSSFLPWITDKILSNGGLRSCNFSLTAPPSPGIGRIVYM